MGKIKRFSKSLRIIQNLACIVVITSVKDLSVYFDQYYDYVISPTLIRVIACRYIHPSF